jgi:hypothetical protein
MGGRCLSGTEGAGCPPPDPAACRDANSAQCGPGGTCVYVDPAPDGQVCAGSDPNKTYSCENGGCVGVGRDGTLALWGRGVDGQLGSGATGSGATSAVPLRLNPTAGTRFPTDTVGAAGGLAHTVALAADGLDVGQERLRADR